MYQSIFSIDSNNKIIVECSEEPLKAKLDHYEGVILQIRNKKIRLQRRSMLCRFFLDLTESLEVLLRNISDSNFYATKKEYGLSSIKNEYKFYLVLSNGKIYFVVRDYYPWYFQKEPYPNNYQTKEEFLATVKPIASLEISLKVARRWYKQAKKISDSIQNNYAQESISSQQKDLVPKKYTITLSLEGAVVSLKTTAPFKDLSCNDKARLAVTINDQNYLVYTSNYIVRCYEPLLDALENFNNNPADIDHVVQPLGLIFEQIRNNKADETQPSSVRKWDGLRYAVWLSNKSNSTTNFWLYPHDGALVLEITPAYNKKESFEDFEQHYKPLAQVLLDKKTIDQWYKKLANLDEIVGGHHDHDCNDK